MGTESKGKEFFSKLSKIEKETILEIMRLEKSPERLLKIRSVVTENKIKTILAKNSMEWNENDF